MIDKPGSTPRQRDLNANGDNPGTRDRRSEGQVTIWGRPVTDDDSGAGRNRRSKRAADLASEPGATHWAGDCGWVPGSGHCRNRPCSPDCVFREQREMEASRIEHERRQRRRDHRAFAERIKRLTWH
jgi:hypothetical protein